MQGKTQGFQGMEVLKVLHAMQDAKVLWLRASEGCARKEKYKGVKGYATSQIL